MDKPLNINQQWLFATGIYFVTVLQLVLSPTKKIKKVVTIVNNLKHGGSQLLLGEGSGWEKQGRLLFIRTLIKIIKK